MNFWKSLSGILTVEFTGAEPEKTLDAITQIPIPVFHVERKGELTCLMEIRRNDFAKTSAVFQKQGDSFRIVGKSGLYWPLRSFWGRPVLLILWVILVLSSVYLPSRIFFVTVEGNTGVPDRFILAAAEECGIRFGASRRNVRSEKVKNALLSSVPQLQWAGINTYGCRAVISVRERREPEAEPDPHVVTSLMADRDGYILSVTVTGGTAKVAPGEAVTKGQLLISGYTDCGIRLQASRARGEVLAQTNRNHTVVIPENRLIPEALPGRYAKISLLVGKKRINLWKDSRISDTGCGRMYEEYYFSLPGGFRLPMGISVDWHQLCQLEQIRITEEEAESRLRKFSEDSVTRELIAGQILRKQQQFSCRDGLYRLESSYVCTEIIGRERREQIGDINEQGN